MDLKTKDSTARSAELWQRAQTLLPGGVSSPVRAFGAVGGQPRFLSHGVGGRCVDVDGNDFIDFVQSWGPLILGHAHPAIVAAVEAALQRGLTFGAPCEDELRLAQLMVDSYPGVERVRFTSSGTEATMSAIRLARGVTGRSRLVKFSGCYHGHSDGLLVAAGSGAITLGQPSSAGVPPEVAELTSVLPLDDEAALVSLFAERGDEIAAVILEPIPANNGLLLQRKKWLEKLRALTCEHGAMLIFDEVISGFRVARGGAAELYGIEPDLVTFGKIVGGGMPCGAFAGPAAHFEHLAPLGPVYQAGTLSGNPLAMAAGARTLEYLIENDAWNVLNESARSLCAKIETRAAQHDWPFRIVRCGSVFWMCLGTRTAPRTAEAIDDGAAEVYSKIHAHCLANGVYLAPSAYEVGFVSMAHTPEELGHAAHVIGDALEEAFR